MAIMIKLFFLTLLNTFCEGIRLNFRSDGSFKILLITDVHLRLGSGCVNFTEPCSVQNSTSLFNYFLDMENPDLVVFNGDLVDWSTVAGEQQFLAKYFNIAWSRGIPWAAVLGNHDDDSWQMPSRWNLCNWISTLPGSLTQTGIVQDSFGNFVLEIFSSSSALLPSFRTYHFDSNLFLPSPSISNGQVSWYVSEFGKRAAVAATPAVAFFHVPLPEWYKGIVLQTPISGSLNEKITFSDNNTGLHAAFMTGDVKAAFCGHDHTNDACLSYLGIQLCYQGSAGYQAYGDPRVQRRARVVQMKAFGSEIWTWKRLDTSLGGFPPLDVETLWAADSKSTDVVRIQRASVPWKRYESLRQRNTSRPVAAG